MRLQLVYREVSVRRNGGSAGSGDGFTPVVSVQLAGVRKLRKVILFGHAEFMIKISNRNGGSALTQ